MTDVDREETRQPRGVLPSRYRHEPVGAGGVDTDDILTRVEELDIRVWRQLPGEAVRSEHLGPAAEEFYESFELGRSPDQITAGDADGVALAAIQGLSVRCADLAARVDRQARKVSDQQSLIAELRDDLETLREQLEHLNAEVVRIQHDFER